MNPLEYAEKRLAELAAAQPASPPTSGPPPTPPYRGGPRTPEGKRRSALNSTRHSLTGAIVIQTAEEQAAFDKHCAEHRDAMAPLGPREIQLAQACAENLWRLKRARAIENSMFAQGHIDHVPDFDRYQNEQVGASLAQAATWKQWGHSFNLLTVYERRIRRDLEKDTAELERLQTARKAAYERDRAEAMLLAELAQSKGEIYDPAPDFPQALSGDAAPGQFVFSAPEIARLISRQNRLEEAFARKKWPHFAYPGLKKAA